MNRQEAFDENYKVASFVQAYDGYFLNIKAWGVTVTAGVITAGFSSGVASSRLAQATVFGIASLLACAFWGSETMFKMLQFAHVRRASELESLLVSGVPDIPGPAYLSSFSTNQAIDRRTRRWRHVLFWPHVMLPHAIFAFLARPWRSLRYSNPRRPTMSHGAAQLWCEADAARLRPGSRAACIFASVTASRQLQFATRFFERHARQLPRRSGCGTRDRPHSLHQGR
jgi:hypothetical protein